MQYTNTKTKFAVHQLEKNNKKTKKQKEAYLGIHIGTIQVNLASMFVNEVTYIPYALLKNSIGGRVSDHYSSQIVLVFVYL